VFIQFLYRIASLTFGENVILIRFELSLPLMTQNMFLPPEKIERRLTQAAHADKNNGQRMLISLDISRPLSPNFIRCGAPKVLGGFSAVLRPGARTRMPREVPRQLMLCHRSSYGLFLGYGRSIPARSLWSQFQATETARDGYAGFFKRFLYLKNMGRGWQ